MLLYGVNLVNMEDIIHIYQNGLKIIVHALSLTALVKKKKILTLNFLNTKKIFSFKIFNINFFFKIKRSMCTTMILIY